MFDSFVTYRDAAAVMALSLSGLLLFRPLNSVYKPILFALGAVTAAAATLRLLDPAEQATLLGITATVAIGAGMALMVLGAVSKRLYRGALGLLGTGIGYVLADAVLLPFVTAVLPIDPHSLGANVARAVGVLVTSYLCTHLSRASIPIVSASCGGFCFALYMDHLFVKTGVTGSYAIDVTRLYTALSSGLSLFTAIREHEGGLILIPWLLSTAVGLFAQYTADPKTELQAVVPVLLLLTLGSLLVAAVYSSQAIKTISPK